MVENKLISRNKCIDDKKRNNINEEIKEIIKKDSNMKVDNSLSIENIHDDEGNIVD